MEKKNNIYNAEYAAVYREAILKAVVDAVITINESGIIETINPAGEKLFGYNEGELIGENIATLMPAPHRENHNQYMTKYLQGGKPKIIGIGREVEGLCKDGKKIPVRLAVSEAWVGERRIFTGIIHDLTAVKEAESKIRKLNEELEQKVRLRTEELVDVVNKLLQANQRLSYENQERRAVEEALRKSENELRRSLAKEKELSQLKSRFVTMASHEFRTPLSAVLSSADLIELYTKGSPDDKRLKHVNRIKSAVTNLTNILDDFLSLSKLEEDRIMVEFSHIYLPDFFAGTVDELKSLLKPGQEIRHVEEVPDIEILTDKKILKNILFNLLSNAIKYSGNDKPIDCIVKKQDNMLVIKIIDQGIGIPEEDQQHLFTRFFRAHNAENIQGTGLGLNIVRRYLDLLDGDITFKSQLGKGSTFTVHIPIPHAGK